MPDTGKHIYGTTLQTYTTWNHKNKCMCWSMKLYFAVSTDTFKGPIAVFVDQPNTKTFTHTGKHPQVNAYKTSKIVHKSRTISILMI